MTTADLQPQTGSAFAACPGSAPLVQATQRAESGIGAGGGAGGVFYRDQLVTLIHGDVLETRSPVPVDLLLSDPPYSRAGGLSTGRSAAHLMAEDNASSDQFWVHWFTAVARGMLAQMKPSGCGLLFCDHRTIHLVERAVAKSGLGWHMSQGLVWDRQSIGLGTPFRAGFEMLAFLRGPDFQWAGRKDMSNVLRCRWPYGAHENHPAEKPVGLLEQIIRECCPKAGVVFDPFAGSGSTLVAAKHVERRAIGIEIEEGYCRVAANRLSAEMSFGLAGGGGRGGSEPSPAEKEQND